MLERMWRKRNPITLLVGMWIGATIVENSMEIPQKTKHRTTIWSSNPTPGHLSRENHNSKDTCTPMFIAVLFAIAKIWKQAKCPSTEQWVKKMWYIYTMEYYSAIKRNEILALLATWMGLDIIILSHTIRHQHQMLSLTCGIWKKDRMNFFAEQILTHRLWKTYGFQMRQVGGWGGCTESLGWKCLKICLWWLLYTYKCVIKFIK